MSASSPVIDPMRPVRGPDIIDHLKSSERDALSEQMRPIEMGLSDRKENMSTVYRIEIDIRIDNRMRTKVIQTAREDYRGRSASHP